MSNGAPFKHERNNEDGYVILNQNNMILNRCLNTENYRGNMYPYANEDMDNDICNNNSCTPHNGEDIPGTQSSSQHIGTPEHYTKHEKHETGNYTDRSERIYVRNKVISNANKKKIRTASADKADILNFMKHNFTRSFKKNVPLPKEANLLKNGKEKYGRSIRENHVSNANKGIKISAFSSKCINNNTTLTNSITANDSSKTISKKDVYNSVKNALPKKGVNKRNLSNFHISTDRVCAKPMHIPDVSQNKNYIHRSKYQEMEPGGSEIEGAMTNRCRPEIAARRFYSGQPVIRNNVHNIMQNSNNYIIGDRREHNYVNVITADNSNNVVHNTKMVNSADIGSTSNSVNLIYDVGQVNRLENSNVHLHRRSISSVTNINKGKNRMGNENMCISMQMNKRHGITQDPVHLSYANPTLVDMLNNGGNTFGGIHKPNDMHTYFNEYKRLVKREELMQNKCNGVNKCNADFNITTIEKRLNEVNLGKSKTYAINNNYNTQIGKEEMRIIHNIKKDYANRNNSQMIERRGKIKQERQNAIEKSNSQVNYEQQNRFANYINEDTMLEKENDLLYFCKEKDQMQRNLTPHNVNYMENAKAPVLKSCVKDYLFMEETRKYENIRNNEEIAHFGYNVDEEEEKKKKEENFAQESVNIPILQNFGQNSQKEKIQDIACNSLEENANFLYRGKEHSLFKNSATNECMETILSKEEFTNIMEEKIWNEPINSTPELLGRDSMSESSTYDVSIDIPKDMNNIFREVEEETETEKDIHLKRETDINEKHLINMNNFQSNEKKYTSDMLQKPLKKYEHGVTRDTIFNQNDIIKKREITENDIHIRDVMNIMEKMNNPLSNQSTINPTTVFNKREETEDIPNEHNETDNRNDLSQNAMTDRNTMLNTSNEETSNFVINQVKTHLSDGTYQQFNGQLFTVKDGICHFFPKSDIGNISRNDGMCTSRTIGHHSYVENNLDNGCKSHRVMGNENKLSGISSHHNNYTHALADHTLETRTFGIKPNVAEPIGNMSTLINKTGRTLHHENNTKAIEENVFQYNNNTHAVNRTVSSRSSTLRKKNNVEALHRCKTINTTNYNNTNHFAQKQNTQNFNDMDVLKTSHLVPLSCQSTSNQKPVGNMFEEKSMDLWNAKALDVTAKLGEESHIVKKAVVIGCNYFRDKEHRLYGAVNDAYVFSSTLVKYFDFIPEDILFMADCFPAEAYVNAEFDLKKEEKEEREEWERKEREKMQKMGIIARDTTRKARNKQNLFSLFNKNNTKIKTNETSLIKEPNSTKSISGKRKNIDLLTNAVHVNLWPTRTNILKAVNWLVRDSVANGTYVFYFAGKSIQVDNMSGWEGEGYDEAFLCSDPFSDDSEYNIITAVQLKDLLLSINSKATMTIVLDCSGCQTILDPAGTENSWSYIKGCKQKGIWPITNPTNKVHKAVYDVSILNNESMRKHYCKSRYSNLVEVESTSAMIDPLLQCISSPTIPPKAYCLCAATWEQVSIEGLFPVFRFARTTQIKKMKIPNFHKKKKKRKKGKNENQQLHIKPTRQKKKSFYEKKFDLSMNMMKTLFASSKNDKNKEDDNKLWKSKKEENVSGNRNPDNAEEEEYYDDNDEEDYDDEEEEEEGEEENWEEEEESEIIVSHGVFTYCLIEAITEFKEMELKNNILENTNPQFLPLTLKNLITSVQEKVQNVKNKKLKKLNQRPEFTVHPGSNASINNYFVHYSKNIHFQNINSNYLGQNLAPYLNVARAWGQINKSTLRQQKSLTLTTSLNKAVRQMSMTLGKNDSPNETSQQIGRI